MQCILLKFVTAYVPMYRTLIRCHVQSPLVQISKGSRLSILDALGHAWSHEFILARNSKEKKTNISLRPTVTMPHCNQDVLTMV